MTKSKSYVPPAQEEIESRIQARVAELTSQSPRSKPDVIRKKAEAEIKSELSAAEKIPNRLRSLKSFDVVTGLSDRYRKLDWQHNGNDVYKYLSRLERTEAIRDIRQIFIGMFGDNPPPTEKELDDFGSFLGILDIMKNRMSPTEIVKVYEETVIRLFGAAAQPLSATDKSEDMSVKDKLLEVFKQVLPEVESSTMDVEAFKTAYYAKYKVRGQEGFAEDDTTPGEVDESRNYRLNRLNRLIESAIWGS